MGKTVEGVLITHDPQGDEAPAVFDSPHAGFDVPDDWHAIQPRKTLWGWGGADNYVTELFQDVPKFGATYLEALFPRSYVDPNRNEDEVDPELLSEPWPGTLNTAGRVSLKSGLFRTLVYPDLPLYDRKFTVAELKHRIETYWRPYQTELQAAMDRAHAKFGVVYHFNCHSNRTRATPGAPEGEGTLRPEMELGTIDGTTCAPEYTAFVKRTLEDMGYQVVVDGFHKGEHLIRHYANPPAGRHCMMIEIRKDLYMDAETIERNDRFAETQANMSKLAQAICDYAREQAKK